MRRYECTNCDEDFYPSLPMKAYVFCWAALPVLIMGLVVHNMLIVMLGLVSAGLGVWAIFQRPACPACGYPYCKRIDN